MRANFIPTTGTIEIRSSQGLYVVNAEDGKVKSRQLETSAPIEYRKLRRFDLEEARRNGLDSLDILNFGYWYEKSGQRHHEYEKPVEDWRKMMIEDELLT